MVDNDQECVNPNLGREIAFICETEEIQQVVDSYSDAEPTWLENLELHPEYCDYCGDHYPWLGDCIEAVRAVLGEKALQEIEWLHKRFVSEFSVPVASEGRNKHFADVLAALATTYAEGFFAACEAQWIGLV